MKSLGWTTPRSGGCQRISASTPVGLNSQVERRLIDEEELAVAERVAQAQLELDAALHGSACRTRRRAAVARRLGAVHRDVCVAQELFGRWLARRSRCRRWPSRQALPRSARSSNGWRAHQQSLGDRLRARVARGPARRRELVAAEAPEGVAVPQHAGAVPRRRAAARHRRRDRACRSSLLKLSRSMNRTATVSRFEPRASACSMRSRSACGWAGRSARRAWPEIRAPPGVGTELLVGHVTLGLKRLRHPHDRHVEAALQHAERVRENLCLRASARARSRAPRVRQRRASQDSVW